MPEPVRLIIWDLDDTFWKGVLTEGNIEQIGRNRDLVISLAQRGIISSICSKNDLARVKSILEAEGLWDYFTFPSINWEPKGPRIKALIEAVQLRPSTVLFIDDNPLNLEEARHFVPELQIASHEYIPHIATDPLFAGKSDQDLTRLRQYKALEHRKLDETAADGNVETFLRQSDIRVSIDHDLMFQLDRAIELINRTNQLNFTKKRLPDDPVQAREELRSLLSSHEIQAGLVKVTDRYGDHGYCGLYIIRHGAELVHFCFSCRILGMGVETWLYRKLQRPRLHIVGEVLSNPLTDKRNIDWIETANVSDPLAAITRPKDFDWIIARGGCDLSALSHYFTFSADRIIGEFNVGRGGFDARVDHSMFLRYAKGGLSGEAIEAAQKLIYRPEDFRSSIFSRPAGRGLIILSFWSDAAYALYRHKKLGFILPFALSGRANHSLDARTAEISDLPEHHRNGPLAEALRTLKADYDFVGLIDEPSFKDNMHAIFGSIPVEIPVVTLLRNTTLYDRTLKMTHTSSHAIAFNAWLKNAAAHYRNVSIVDIRDFIESEDEVPDWSHFDRLVYFRLYNFISKTWGLPMD